MCTNKWIGIGRQRLKGMKAIKLSTNPINLVRVKEKEEQSLAHCVSLLQRNLRREVNELRIPVSK